MHANMNTGGVGNTTVLSASLLLHLCLHTYFIIRPRVLGQAFVIPISFLVFTLFTSEGKAARRTSAGSCLSDA